MLVELTTCTHMRHVSLIKMFAKLHRVMRKIRKGFCRICPSGQNAGWGTPTLEGGPQVVPHPFLFLDLRGFFMGLVASCLHLWCHLRGGRSSCPSVAQDPHTVPPKHSCSPVPQHPRDASTWNRSDAPACIQVSREIGLTLPGPWGGVREGKGVRRGGAGVWSPRTAGSWKHFGPRSDGVGGHGRRQRNGAESTRGRRWGRGEQPGSLGGGAGRVNSCWEAHGPMSLQGNLDPPV